jgi:hypothetical protein
VLCVFLHLFVLFHKSRRLSLLGFHFTPHDFCCLLPLFSKRCADATAHTNQHAQREKPTRALSLSASLHTHIFLGKLCPTQSCKLFFFVSSLASFGVRGSFATLSPGAQIHSLWKKKHSQMTQEIVLSPCILRFIAKIRVNQEKHIPKALSIACHILITHRLGELKIKFYL